MPRSDKAAPALLIALGAGLYLPHLLSGDTLPATDLAATYLPWRQGWGGQARAGTWRLCDPSSNHGRTLWADPHRAAAYPPTLLFARLAPERASPWHVALHHLLLIAGCFVVARRCGAAPGPAAAGAPRHGPGPRPAGAGEG